MTFLSIICVALGGAVGAVFRYLIGLVPIKELTSFPIITLIVNIFGAFLIGIIASYASKKGMNDNVLLFLKVGLCGGFTTFSTFSLETIELLKNGQYAIAICYIILSVVLCILATFAAGATMIKSA